AFFRLAPLPGTRAEAVQIAGEPRLLLVEVIELRIAARNRRRIVPDLRGESAPEVLEVEPDFVPHRLELHRVRRGFRRGAGVHGGLHSGLMPAAFTMGHHFSISAL